MIIDLADDLRTARLQVILTALTPGSALWLYTEPKPERGAAITSQTLLVAVPLDDPAGSISFNVLTLNLLNAQAVASGDAAWARLVSGAAAFRIDFDVTVQGGGGAVTLDDVTLYAGGTVQKISATLTEP